jgi:hypothetical protein
VRRRTALAALLATIGPVAAACAPVAAPVPPSSSTPPTSTVPGAPVINSFTATPGAAAAPALVALSWSVSDPEGDPVVCLIDTDGDGDDDLTIADCTTPGSRNVTLTTPGTVSARLFASDGTDSTERTVPITVQAGPTEPYDIDLRVLGTPTAGQLAAIEAAAARWESVVVRGVPDQSISVAAASPACGGVNQAFTGPVDDLLIDVDISSIDGPGNILGQAGPCVIAADGRSRFGVLQLDADDLSALGADELLDLVTHEMAHVIGYGTLWSGAVLAGYGTSDPRFVGARSIAEWSALGRTGTVPVESGGGEGTAYAHWRETVFGNELMTGYLDLGPNPLSALSIASLADIGYQVDVSRADPYTLPFPALRRSTAALPPPGRFILISPYS